MLILRRLEIDWDGFVKECIARRFTQSVAIGLRYLRGRFAAVPLTVIESLERVRAPRYERRELARRRHQTGPLSGLEFHRSNYRYITGELPAWQRAGRFPAYLRDWWGLGSTWSGPAEGLAHWSPHGIPGLRSRHPTRGVEARGSPSTRICAQARALIPVTKLFTSSSG